MQSIIHPINKVFLTLKVPGTSKSYSQMSLPYLIGKYISEMSKILKKEVNKSLIILQSF